MVDPLRPIQSVMAQRFEAFSPTVSEEPSVRKLAAAFALLTAVKVNQNLKLFGSTVMGAWGCLPAEDGSVEIPSSGPSQSSEDGGSVHTNPDTNHEPIPHGAIWCDDNHTLGVTFGGKEYLSACPQNAICSDNACHTSPEEKDQQCLHQFNTVSICPAGATCVDTPMVSTCVVTDLFDMGEESDHGFYTEPREDLSQAFGWEFTGGVRQDVCGADDGYLLSYRGGAWTVAYFDASLQTQVSTYYQLDAKMFFPDGEESTQFQIDSTFTEETSSGVGLSAFWGRSVEANPCIFQNVFVVNGEENNPPKPLRVGFNITPRVEGEKSLGIAQLRLWSCSCVEK